jgi:hypothetical protein
MRVAILWLCLLATVGTARAGEAKIDVKELPTGVLAAVRAKFPEGKLMGAAKEEEDRKMTYEVTLSDSGAKIDVAVSAKWKILEVEKTIDAKELPEAVAATIRTKYPTAKVSKAEQTIKYEEAEEETTYEVVLSTAGKKDVEVELSPKGKVLDDEGDEDEDEEAGKEKKDKV